MFHYNGVRWRKATNKHLRGFKMYGEYFAPMAAVKENMTPMENDDRVNWKTISESLVQELQARDAVSIVEVIKMLRDKYPDLPPSYTGRPRDVVYNIGKVIRRTLVGSPYDVAITKTHPKTGETVPTIETGWFYLSQGKGVPLTATSIPAVPVSMPTAAPSPKPIEPMPPLNFPPALQELIPKSPKRYFPRSIDGMSDIEILKKAFSLQENVLLSGPPGGGKTHAIETMAFEMQLPYKRVELYGGITAADLIGQYVPATPEDIKEFQDKGLPAPRFVWMDGVLTQMVHYGGIFIADEINAMPRDLAMKLHGLLDHERRLVIPEAKDEKGNPGKIVKAGPTFMFIAAMNPDVAGVHPLGPALKDRFHIILDYGYDTSVEEKVLQYRCKELGIPYEKKIITWAEIMREAFDKTVHTHVSTRMLEQYLLNLKEFGQKRAINFLMNKFEVEERDKVKEWFENLLLKGRGADDVRKAMLGED